MSAWMLGQIRITDRRRYREYAERFPAVLAKHRGELVCLADDFQAMEGDWAHPRTVLIKFPDEATALAWYRSPEYQELVAIRQDAAVSNIVLVKNLLDSPPPTK